MAPLEVLTLPAANGSDHQRPPLLFVHGAWHGAWCWTAHFMPFFAHAGYECHALSLRGHGESPGRERLNHHRLHHYTDDVVAVIASLDRAPVVLGHSMGGMVVQHLLARRDRPRLPAAVLLASAPPQGVLRVTVDIAREDPGRFARVNLQRDLGLLVDSPALARRRFFSESLPPDDVRRHHAQLQSESYLAFLDMLVLHRPRPRPVGEPVLVLAAAADAIFTVAEAATTARAWQAESVVIGGLAHDVMLDTRWREAAQSVLRWLEARRPDLERGSR